MTMGKLCYALVTTLVVTMIGCGGDVQDVQDVNESQTSQEITQCEVFCPGGQVLVCTAVPCSVTSLTSMNCNGTAMNCSCIPNTCGTSCGLIPDGCGGTLNCGPPPTTCAAQGAQCGSISNGCGGTLSCGVCPGQQTCSSNHHCVCRTGTHDCGDGTCVSNGASCP